MKAIVNVVVIWKTGKLRENDWVRFEVVFILLTDSHGNY